MPWQYLNFLPDPQGHFSFLPTFFSNLSFEIFSLSSFCSSLLMTIFKFNRNFIKSFLIFSNKPSNKIKASFLNSDKGSFWPYCLRPITCLSCSRYCKCDLQEKSIICKNIFFSRLLFWDSPKILILKFFLSGYKFFIFLLKSPLLSLANSNNSLSLKVLPVIFFVSVRKIYHQQIFDALI